MNRKLTALLLAALLLLAGCDVSSEVLIATGQTDAAAATQQPETTATETSTVEPSETAIETQTETAPMEDDEDYTGVYVYSIFSDTYEIDGVNCCFNIPSISVDEVETEDANAQIWSDLYDNVYVPLVEDPMAEYGNCDIASLDFNYYIGNGILSVVTEYRGFYSDMKTVRPYNVLIHENRLATREEVLQMFGMTEQEYLAKCADIIGCYAWEEMQQALEMSADMPDFAEQIYNDIRRSASADNASASVPFVNESGELCICANIYVPAGSGMFYALIPMNYQVSDAYYDVITMIG